MADDDTFDDFHFSLSRGFWIHAIYILLSERGSENERANCFVFLDGLCHYQKAYPFFFGMSVFGFHLGRIP